MDIRGFFSTDKQEKKRVAEREKKRAAIIIDDDDDDEDFKPASKPSAQPKDEKLRKKRPRARIQYESDSDEESTLPKTSKTTSSPVKEKKLDPKMRKKPDVKRVVTRREETTAAAFFGSAPIKRTQVVRKRGRDEEKAMLEQDSGPIVIPESPPHKQCPPMKEEHEDRDFSETLAQLDQPASPPPAKDRKRLAEKLSKKTAVEQTRKRDVTPPVATEPAKRTPSTSPARRIPSWTMKSSTDDESSSTKGPRENPKSKTPEKKASVLLGLSKPNRNNSSFIAYLNRGGPRAPGSKTIPVGAEDCLKGLTFVLTGVGESLDQEETADLLKKYGGRVTKSVSGKTSYLVVGDEGGVRKLEKARELGVKTIDEDELLQLIETRSAQQGLTQTAPEKEKSKRGHRRSQVETKEVTRRGSTSTPLSPIAESVGSASISVITPTTPSSMTEVGTSLGGHSSVPTPTTPSSTVTVGTPLSGQLSESLMWVDKYRPKSTRQIVGQQGERSNVKKLASWLRDWYIHHGQSSQATKKPHGARFGQDDGSSFRAALLSGPPGVGKTTSATLVCKEQGFLYTEMNASDTRNKQSLKGMVMSQTSSLAVDAFVTGGAGYSAGKRHVLIMDEVDGMSGNEDRGGVQELIQLIKSTRVPIICICNDRQHPKIRSLANYCYDLRFQRPRAEQIKGMMLSVAYKEGFKISSQALHEIIVASGHDIRQILHNLSIWTSTSKNLSYEEATDSARTTKKEMKLGPFDVIRVVFMPKDGERELTLSEKTDLFFHDYSIGPLFVQENYLNVKPVMTNDLRTILQLTSQTADSICMGDLVSKLIRTQSSWGLLPTQALFSSVMPGEYMRGHLGRPEFPSWLGNNSRQGKNDRLLQELQQHTQLTASCSKLEFGLDYLPILSSRLTQPMVEKGSEGVAEAVEVMVKYTLTREDWESVQDIAHFSGRAEPASGISSKVKSQFTRVYNKEVPPLPYSVESVVKKRMRSVMDEDGEESSTDSSNEDDVSKDPMIKVKKARTSPLQTEGGANVQKKRKGKAGKK